MIALLANRFVLAGAVIAVAAAGVVYLRYDAVQRERARQEAEELRRNLDTRKRIDDAISTPRDADSIRDRLRRLAE